MTTTAEQLAAYKAQIDAKYARGYVPAKSAAAQRHQRIAEDRAQPGWLLLDPNGVVDGFHTYSRDLGWDTTENVWEKFEKRKRDRERLQSEGWTVIRDDGRVRNTTPTANEP
ncbi:hypothetical protein LT337_32255 (plasmid) [Mycolicibacterium fortuitum]|nr:hypothetical protein LT337_32255 [Mycolicibacterium fortuitum]